MDADWDNLIILDGCRYDIFEEHCKLDGKLEKRISVGSSTPEFLRKTFKGKRFHDTVYVTGNPQLVSRDYGDVFHHVVNVWDNGWDGEHNTVLPETMVDATKEANKTFCNKRLLCHFMQPHYPFIGPLAEEIGNHAGIEYARNRAIEGSGHRSEKTIWQQLDDGDVDYELVWNAYVENLNIVLQHVQETIDALDGRTIVTSDHGNLVTESRIIAKGKSGHPGDTHAPELVEVPWFIVDSDNRRTLTAETPVDQNEVGADVSSRLHDLGYLD